MSSDGGDEPRRDGADLPRKPLSQQVQDCMKSWATEAKELAREGDVEGMEQFGLMAYYGYGTHQSYNVAMRWLEEAASKGSLPAKEFLAEISQKKASSASQSKS